MPRPSAPLARATLLLFACAVCLCACTSLSERGEISVAIAADAEVRTKVEEVVALVEMQASDSGWSQIAMRRIEVNPSTAWPIAFIANSASRSGLTGTYQLTASARDAHGAVVAQARAIREFRADASHLSLDLRFEAACMFRPQPCGSGSTCHEAECVDARQTLGPSALAADSSDPQRTARPGEAAAPDVDLPCTQLAARGCAGNASRVPLLCDGTAWRLQIACSEHERCATTPGPDQGRCLPIATECETREPGSTFCRDDQMLACQDLVTLEPRPCDANMRCLTTAAGARCACVTGFRPDAAGGCSEASDCGPDRGGCDPHSLCSMREGKRTCGPCPDGYSGGGDQGCKPLLVSLSPSMGALVPSLNPDDRTYRLHVPLLAQRITLDLRGPALSQVEVNGRSLIEPGRWSSDILNLGENTCQIAVIADSGATTTYTLVIERTGAQIDALKAFNAGDNDMLGISLGISGNTLVTSAIYEDGSASGVNGEPNDSAADSGAAYVYVREGEHFRHEAYLKADDSARGGYFGISAAVSGDTIAIGGTRSEPFSGVTTPTRSGAAYVFTRTQAGWKQQQRVEPDGGKPGDLFGYHLAIEGDTLLVGAANDGAGGAAYVFTRSGGRWTQLQKLTPSSQKSGADFGCFVAISGDTLAVGAQSDDAAARGGGAVYVFVKQGGTWLEQQQLVPEDTKDNAAFGYGLALNGERLVVGAPQALSLLSVTRRPSGEAFVFERRDARWTLTARLQAAVPRDSDHFGASVALNASTLVVGAVGDVSSSAGIGTQPMGSGLTFSGAAQLYAYDGKAWRRTAFIKSAEPRADAWFGFAAALTDDALVISAAFDSGGSRNSGATYTFR